MDVIEVYAHKVDGDKKWDWRRKSENGQITATSGGQGYENQKDALNAAADNNNLNDARIEIVESYIEED